MTGIEPALSAWEADVLPLNYIRLTRRFTLRCEPSYPSRDLRMTYGLWSNLRKGSAASRDEGQPWKAPQCAEPRMCAVAAQRCVDCGVEAPELYVAGSPRPDGRRQTLGGRRGALPQRGPRRTRPPSRSQCRGQCGFPSAANSPKRSPHHAAISMRLRHRSPAAAIMASNCSSVIIGCSTDSSRPALRMEQGFFATRPSSVAVCMMGPKESVALGSGWLTGSVGTVDSGEPSADFSCPQVV
jgi:hypothetical protein